MGFWKGLVDKATKKKEELEEEAKKRAAKKAAEMAIDTGKAAARSAVKNAGKTLDYAGKKLGEALFGPEEGEEAPPSSSATAAPDPFAKLKAEEAARKLATQKEKTASKEREQARERTEREVDDELAALKKKIRGQ